MKILARFSLFNLLNGIKRVVHLQLFLDRINMKISPDFCRFKFIIGNKMTCFRSLFYFFQIEGTNYEKYSLIIMVKQLSQVLFYTFSGLGDTNLRKSQPWSLLKFFQTLKMKNTEFLLYWTR